MTQALVLPAFVLLPALALFVGARPVAAQHFEEIASELADALHVVDTSVRPDLSNDGRVAFAGVSIGSGTDKIFVGRRDGLVTVNLPSFHTIRNVEVDNLGHVVWASSRSSAGINYRGVYRTRVPGILLPFPLLTVYEGEILPYDSLQPPAKSQIALSSHGELLYSNLNNGDGGVYKGPIGGAMPLFVEGSGTYFNHLDLDLNDAGEVAVQLEYLDPILNLSRGIFVFDAPLQGRDDSRTAVEKLGIDLQYAPDLNNAGQVAFVAYGNPTMTFYDPPDDANGQIVAEIELSHGIWLATPTSFGQPPNLTQLVDTTTGFSSIGQVLLDDFGRIVFSATKTGGGSGIYTGPDPVADKVVEDGDTLQGRLISSPTLGKGNDWGQFTLISRDGFTLDRQIWRVTPVPAPEPHSSAMLVAGVAALAAASGRAKLRS